MELKAGVQIGNIVHNDIVCTRNEDNSPVVSSYKTDELRNTESNPEKLYNHVRPLIPQRPGSDPQLAQVLRCGVGRRVGQPDLFHMLDARDNEPSGGPAEGTKVAGGRAYFLKGHGAMLNQVGLARGCHRAVVYRVGYIMYRDRGWCGA